MHFISSERVEEYCQAIRKCIYIGLMGTCGEGGPKALVIHVGEPTASCWWAATRRHPLSVRVL